MPKIDRPRSKPSASSPARQPAVPEFFSDQVAHARRFYLDLNPAPSRRLAVVCGGLEHSTPAYRVQRATFPFYSLEYVQAGRGRLVLGGRAYVLEPGVVFAYGPGIAQDIRSDSEQPLVKYFVDFTGRKAKALLEGCPLPPGSARRIHPAAELQALFEELLRHGLSASPVSNDICALLLECIALAISGARRPGERRETPAFTQYQQCREHIQQHFIRLKGLKEIGSECHLNQAYICRLFRRYDHQSPYRFLLRLKMNRAAELLERPGSLVKHVAEETGFSDPFHFSRAFKSVFGLSPDAFRRFR